MILIAFLVGALAGVLLVFVRVVRRLGYIERLPPRVGRLAATAGRHRIAVIASVLIVLFAGLFAYDYAHEGGPPPQKPGAYQVVPPALFQDARLSDAAWLRFAVWSDWIKRFPGATPVAAIYAKDGKPTLYVWGAEGKLADPAGEMAALWQNFDPVATQDNAAGLPGDTEPAGSLGGYLQCQELYQVCAWADNSGIVVVSPQPPNATDLITIGPGASISEQQMAALTLSFRDAAEHLSHAS